LIQVASIDTLLIRLKKGAMKFDLVIFDEAHHVVADNKWGRVFEQLGRPPMLGVTATPVRTDGKGLGEHAGGLFKTMVLGPSKPELIERGNLIASTVYCSFDTPDLKGVGKNKDGEYNANEVAARVDKPHITGSAVAHYTEICPGARAIVFCASVKHAQHVADEFNAAGYRFALLVGEPHMSDAERTAVNKKLRTGELQGACTVDLVSEGYDLPALQCCIMLRPTASESLFLQQVGRVERPEDGKTEAWLLDHVGNVGMMVDGTFKRKHGMPNEDREWTLDGRKKGKGKAKDEEDTVALKQCPKCFHVHEPAPACPVCKFEYPIAGPRQLEQVEGKLGKVTAEMAAALSQKKREEQGRAQTVDEMVNVLGYSRGRAEKIDKARREKQDLIDRLTTGLDAWRARTGKSVLSEFGKSMTAIKSMKPKELREWRDRLLETVKAGEVTYDVFDVPDEAAEYAKFQEFMRRTLGEIAEEKPALV
jgi:superfamily II DNA or RNA helicase